MVELFGRRKGEWVRRARASEEGIVSSRASAAVKGSSGDRKNDIETAHKKHGGHGTGRAVKEGKTAGGKTAIQLAREKFASMQSRKTPNRHLKARG